jgi:hypothetical protein
MEGVVEPRRNKILILLAIVAGLIFTQACGGSNSSGTSSGASNTDGVTITNEVNSPAEMGVGDIMMAEFGTSGAAEFDFDGVDATSQYYLAVGSIDSIFGTHSVSIQSALSELAPKALAGGFAEEEKWESWTVEDAFQQRLYDFGAQLAVDPEVALAVSGFTGSKSAVTPKAASVGDTKVFRVLNSLSSMSSYARVTGKVRCVTSRIVMYVDTEVESVNPDDLTDSDVRVLCDNFDSQVALERSWFGSESDVNSDGKVAALLTPQVNRLGAMGGGIITGFFLAADLFERTGSNQVSNEMEIVYVLVPDSGGSYGVVIPKAFGIDNLLTAVLPHELQHVISYNQHVFEGEGSPEASWLNEGLSHLVEDLVGYGQENYSRVSIFLNNTTSYQLVASGSPDLGERGASYLFIRFLYEQSADKTSFLWDLFHGNMSSVANIEAAYAGTETNFDQFGEFFMRWMTAISMTNQGLSSDPRYVYQPRTFNDDTQRWQGVCLVCDADDGRGTILSGPSTDSYTGSENVNIYSSSSQYYSISSLPNVIGFNSSSGSFGTVLVRKQ